jgi:hypothetical protein
VASTLRAHDDEDRDSDVVCIDDDDEEDADDTQVGKGAEGLAYF